MSLRTFFLFFSGLGTGPEPKSSTPSTTSPAASCGSWTANTRAGSPTPSSTWPCPWPSCSLWSAFASWLRTLKLEKSKKKQAAAFFVNQEVIFDNKEVSPFLESKAKCWKRLCQFVLSRGSNHCLFNNNLAFIELFCFPVCRNSVATLFSLGSPLA